MLLQDDVTANEVVKALSDEYSRKIVLSIMSKTQRIEEISKGQDIPISTCYRRIRHLMRFGIVRPFKTVIDENGKKFIFYGTSFSNVSIRLESGEIMVDVRFESLPERLRMLNSSIGQTSLQPDALHPPTPLIRK